MAEFITIPNFNRLYPIIQCNKHGKNIGDDAKGEENEREKLVRIYLYFFANRLSRCDDHSGEIDEKGCAVEFLTKPLKRVARISTHTRTLRSADAWRKLRSPPQPPAPSPPRFAAQNARIRAHVAFRLRLFVPDSNAIPRGIDCCNRLVSCVTRSQDLSVHWEKSRYAFGRGGKFFSSKRFVR